MSWRSPVPVCRACVPYPASRFYMSRAKYHRGRSNVLAAGEDRSRLPISRMKIWTRESLVVKLVVWCCQHHVSIVALLDHPLLGSLPSKELYADIELVQRDINTSTSREMEALISCLCTIKPHVYPYPKPNTFLLLVKSMLAPSTSD